MRSHARVGPHPMHPMLVMFPVALFPLLVVLDALHGYSDEPMFWNVGIWIAGLGVLSTLVAMVPGFVDLAAIPNESRAHKTALLHMVVGIIILALFGASVWARWPAGSSPARFPLATAIDVLGLVAIVAQGWLGGELVYRHHIGVLGAEEGSEPVILESGRRPASPGDAREGVRRRGASRP